MVSVLTVTSWVLTTLSDWTPASTTSMFRRRRMSSGAMSSISSNPGAASMATFFMVGKTGGGSGTFKEKSNMFR